MRHEHAHHDQHAGHSVAMFRDRFWLSLLLTIPVVIWSHDLQEWLGYGADVPAGRAASPAVLGHRRLRLRRTASFSVGRSGSSRDRQPGMMTLISPGHHRRVRRRPWAATLGLFEVEIWWELSTLITIMLLGHWLEMRSIAQARGALAALAELLPDTAERVTGDGTDGRPAVASSRVGDVVLVRPGARVPADGDVRRGRGRCRRIDDHRRVAGRSPRSPGDAVVAGTVAAGGSLRVPVTAVGDETALSGIMRLVAAAQASASRAQALADRAAAVLFYVALGAGTVTLVVLVAARRPRRRAHPDGHRARHRLPPRARARHPAGHRHQHRRSAPATDCWSRTGWRSSGRANSTSSSSTRPAR